MAKEVQQVTLVDDDDDDNELDEQNIPESDDNNEDNDVDDTPPCDAAYGADNDADVECDDDKYDDHDHDDDDDDDDDDDNLAHEPYRLFFQQLLEAQKKDIKKRKQERFLPLVKGFLKASFAKKEKMITDNPRIIGHMVFLCRNIINGKIPCSITGADKALMTLIADKHTDRQDVRLHLLEDYRTHYYCNEALPHCETLRENGGRREKTDIDGHGEVQQHDDTNRTTCEPTENSRRRKKNTNRSRTYR
jgi:hypothetical protein